MALPLSVRQVVASVISGVAVRSRGVLGRLLVSCTDTRFAHLCRARSAVRVTPGEVGKEGIARLCTNLASDLDCASYANGVLYAEATPAVQWVACVAVCLAVTANTVGWKGVLSVATANQLTGCAALALAVAFA